MAFRSVHASTPALWLGLSALALFANAPAPALAGPPGGKIQPKATARSQADRGYELFEAGQYVEAAQAFRLAEVIFHAPTLVFAIARAESKAGHLIEARALFKQVIAEKLAPSAPPEFHGAQESSQGELAALEPRIPRVVITVNGAAGRTFVVSLDDSVVARSALEQPIEVDPGPHHLVVLPDGGAAEKRDVTVAEGAREAIVIDLPPPKVVVGPPVRPLPPKPRDLRAPALVSLGVGAAGIGAGATLGGITLAKTSAIRSHCVGDVCPLAQQSAADSARTTATISTVAFVVGGAFAATGLTLLVLRQKAQKPSIGLALGPGAVLAQGEF
jgi:hypothetical protein